MMNNLKATHRRPLNADGFPGEFYILFFKELILILYKLFQKIEKEGTLPNSFYEVSMTLKLKPDKYINNKPIPLMNIDVKMQKNI